MFVPGVQTLPVGRLSLPLPPEELDLDRDRKLLVFPHALGRLAVDHDTAVLEGPLRAALALVADEPILDPQPIVRILVLGEQVAELVVELGILIIGDLEDAVFDAERIAIIVARVIALDLGLPALEVLAVEERNPAVFAGQVLCSRDRREWARARMPVSRKPG